MSMNFLDAAGVLADSADVAYHDLLAREARSIVQAMVAAYDALAPDWSQAPKDAQWCVIESTGDCYWHEAEPTPVGLSWKSGTADFAGFVFVIPLGIDWRLCKWQRPEVAA
jgi:hypothetical protein